MLSVEAEPCRTLSLIKVSYTDFNSWQKRQPKNQRNMRQPSCLRASRYKGTSSLLSRRWQNTSVPTAAMEGANTRPSITASGAESLCENVHCSCFFSLKIHCLTFIVISETWWTCWLSNCKVSYHKNTHKRKATGPWFFFSPLAMNSEQTAIRTTLSFFFFLIKQFLSHSEKRWEPKAVELSCLYLSHHSKGQKQHWRTTLLFRARLATQVLHWLIFLKTDGPHAKS